MIIFSERLFFFSLFHDVEADVEKIIGNIFSKQSHSGEFEIRRITFYPQQEGFY